MTPEEFEREMAEIAHIIDPEASHMDADDLMCKVLKKLGYSDGVEIFERMPKWYS